MYRHLCLFVALAIVVGCKQDNDPKGDKSPPPADSKSEKKDQVTPTADDSKEREKLQGTWLAVEADDIGGKRGMDDEILKGINMRWVFKDKQATTFRRGEVDLDGGSLHLDVSQKPKQFEMRMKTGRPYYRGIYELDGDTMRVCIVYLSRASNEPYPSDFQRRKEEPEWFTYTFKKQP